MCYNSVPFVPLYVNETDFQIHFSVFPFALIVADGPVDVTDAVQVWARTNSFVLFFYFLFKLCLDSRGRTRGLTYLMLFKFWGLKFVF